jgi:hypothetical protein
MTDPVQPTTSTIPKTESSADSSPSDQALSAAHSAIAASLGIVGMTGLISSIFEHGGGTDVALEAFRKADIEGGFTNGLINSDEAAACGLAFHDTDGDGYMSASEIDFFGEADRVGGVVDELINVDEAKQQGLAFYDGDGDSLMSRAEYDTLRAGKADVFGAADRAGVANGGVEDGLITREEAEAQGLMFLDESFIDADADGFMSRTEYERGALQSSSTVVAHLTTGPNGEVHALSPEEASDNGLVFFDGNGDGLMSGSELFQVLSHQVGGLPPH